MKPDLTLVSFPSNSSTKIKENANDATTASFTNNPIQDDGRSKYSRKRYNV